MNIDSNPNPSRPTGWGIFLKVALTCIPDPNRSTAIDFVDVNGRSVDGGGVVEGEKCPTPYKKKGGLVREGKCPEEYVWRNTFRGKCPDPTIPYHTIPYHTIPYHIVLKMKTIQERNGLPEEPNGRLVEPVARCK